MPNIRTYIVVFVLSITLTSTFAQDDDFHPPNYKKSKSLDKKSSKEKRPDKGNFSWDRVFTGGNLGLNFGTETYVSVNPTIGYRLTDKFLVGTNLTYTYYNDRFLNYQTSSYGAGLFSRYLIFESIFAHAEYEVLNFEPAFISSNGLFILPRRWVPSFFVGGGYRQRIGERSSFNILLLFNVLDNQYSPYRNPVVRMGFNIGL